MGAFSDYAESGLLSHLFRTDTFSKPSVIAVAACGSPPVDADTGALTGKEIANAGSYARQTLNPLDANWAYGQENGTGYVSNLSTITFPVASADWGWVSGIAITTSATHGAGNYLIGGRLQVPKLIGNGDQLKLNAGDARIYLG
jgi:hypothetical protein